MLERGDSITPEPFKNPDDVSIIFPEYVQRQIQEAKPGSPRCELFCPNVAVFYVHYSDGSGGFGCMEHGETLEDGSLTSRVDQIRGRGPNAIAGNAIFQLTEGKWVPLNWLTLRPTKTEQEFLPMLSPRQKSLYTFILITLNDEIAIELEKRYRKQTGTEKAFRNDEDPTVIQGFDRAVKLIGDKTSQAVAENNEAYFARFRGLTNEEQYRLEYKMMSEENPEVASSISVDDHLRLTKEWVAAFLGMDPDLKQRYKKAKTKMRNLLQQALKEGMDNIDLVQILAVAHKLPISNDEIRRWAALP